jgi:hypothetical protein
MSNDRNEANFTTNLSSFFFELPSKVLPKLPSFNISPSMKTQHKKKPLLSFFSLFPSLVA